MGATILTTNPGGTEGVRSPTTNSRPPMTNHGPPDPAVPAPRVGSFMVGAVGTDCNK